MKINLPLRVVAFETDYGGVVSNTRYLEYIERGRYALLHAGGINVSEFWREHGVQPVVRRVEIEYLGFAGHEDELALSVEVVEHGGTTTTLAYECRRISDGLVTMRARQTLAYINARFRPTRVPVAFRQALSVEAVATQNAEPDAGEDSQKQA